jgi:inositol transport system substrate-binding protein
MRTWQEDTVLNWEAGLTKDPQRYIYVILLRYPDRFSKLFRFFSRSKYSHVSIGVSDSDWTFYSYVLKGFRREYPRKHPTFKTQEIPCELYRIEVSEEKYHVARSVLENHATKRSGSCRFSYLGLLLCYMRINLPLKDRYFCSQFVSEILEITKAVPLTKHSSLYLPDDFMQMNGLEHCYSGYLSQLVNPSPSAKLSFA